MRRGGCPAGTCKRSTPDLWRRNLAVPYRRERWQTPDEDFIDLDWLDSSNKNAELVVLFHGLEGCSSSHYATSLMATLARHGWGGVVPHFRGCSAEANRLPRSYHAGDSPELDWILRRLKEENPQRQIYVVAISLGGNMLSEMAGRASGSGAGHCRARPLPYRRRSIFRQPRGSSISD